MRRKTHIILSSEQKRLVWHLMMHGPMGRSDIAVHLDMHNASVTKLVRELLLLGCLDEQDGQLTGRGRPIVPLTISGRAGYSAGAMVHPGWLELVLVDFAGTIMARHQEPFKSSDPRVFIERVDIRLRELALETNLMRSRFLGLGVAIPGAVTSVSSSHRWTVKWLEGWREVEHPRFFEDVLGVPVWVENESTLAGLADFHESGLMRRCSSAIALFVGHGVGGSIISRRSILSGEYGNAGDLGRLFPSLERPRPSGIDLLKEINAAGGKLESLLHVDRCLETHADVIDAWIQRASDQLLTLAASGAAWLDPGAIIISGSLPQPILNAIGERIRKAEWIFGFTPMPRPSFYVSKMGSWATSIGAAMLPIHSIINVAG
jgi:predicted NBD/HSP70 family sugar kinase